MRDFDPPLKPNMSVRDANDANDTRTSRSGWRVVSPERLGATRVESNEIVIRERSRSPSPPPPRSERPRATFAIVEEEPSRDPDEVIIRRRREEEDEVPDRYLSRRSGRTEDIYVERSRSPPAHRYHTFDRDYISILPEPKPTVDTSFELFSDKVNMEWEINLQSLFFKAGFSRAAYDSIIDRHKQKELEKRKLRKLGNIPTWMDRSWDSSFYPEIANHMDDYYRISGHQPTLSGKTPQPPQIITEAQGDKETEKMNSVRNGANAPLDSDKNEGQQPKPDTESKPDPDRQPRSRPPSTGSDKEIEAKIETGTRDGIPIPLLEMGQDSTEIKVPEINLEEDELEAVSVWGFRPHKALSQRIGSSKDKHNRQQARPSVVFLPNDPVTLQRTIAISIANSTSATKIYKIRENDFRSVWKFLVLPNTGEENPKYLVALPPRSLKEQPTVLPLEEKDSIIHSRDSDTSSDTSYESSDSESTKKKSKRSKSKKKEKHSKDRSRRRYAPSSSVYTYSDETESSSSSDERDYTPKKKLKKSKNSKDTRKDSVRSRFRRHVAEPSTSSDGSDSNSESDASSSSEYEYKIQKKRISKSKGDKAKAKEKDKKRKKSSKLRSRRRGRESSSDDEDNDD